MLRRLAAAVSGALVVTSCRGEVGAGAAGVRRELFGTTPDGQSVELITLTNGRGMELRAMTRGATITHLRVPDRSGTLGDVVLGYDSLSGYLASSPYFGAVVGRYGNRIARGRFTLGGQVHALATNNGPNHLHGGVQGFDKVAWRAETFEMQGARGVTFRYVSRDGEEEVLEISSARASGTDVAPAMGAAAAGSERIKKTADGKFLIDRRELESTVANINEVFTQARAVPFFHEAGR